MDRWCLAQKDEMHLFFPLGHLFCARLGMICLEWYCSCPRTITLFTNLCIVPRRPLRNKVGTQMVQAIPWDRTPGAWLAAQHAVHCATYTGLIIKTNFQKVWLLYDFVWPKIIKKYDFSDEFTNRKILFLTLGTCHAELSAPMWQLTYWLKWPPPSPYSHSNRSP